MKKMLLLFLMCFSCIVSAQDFRCHKESLPDMAWKETCIFTGQSILSRVIPPKRAASKSRINTSPAFSAGRVSLLKPSYAFALE